MPGLRRASEPATVAKILDVQRDQARRLVRRELLDELRRFQVGLVSDRDEPGDAKACTGRRLSDLEAQISALGDQAHRARLELSPREAEVSL
jgi:hypothetical protein